MPAGPMASQMLASWSMEPTVGRMTNSHKVLTAQRGSGGPGPAWAEVVSAVYRMDTSPDDWLVGVADATAPCLSQSRGSESPLSSGACEPSTADDEGVGDRVA